jgi:hypothetical protein
MLRLLFDCGIFVAIDEREGIYYQLSGKSSLKLRVAQMLRSGQGSHYRHLNRYPRTWHKETARVLKLSSFRPYSAARRPLWVAVYLPRLKIVYPAAGRLRRNRTALCFFADACCTRVPPLIRRAMFSLA